MINYEKKEIIHWQWKRSNSKSVKKFFIYAKKHLMLMRTIKNIINSEIIVIIQKNIKGLLTIFVIKDIKYQKKFI